MNCVVSTIPERCKRCYCCVRECPANAIQIQNGQAVVLSERCVGCGNCLKVCTQNAKSVRDGIAPLRPRLEAVDGTEKVALIAPSFPAAFPTIDPLRVVGALRLLGFTRVIEVAFGADLVSEQYRIHAARSTEPVITTPCPAIVEYIEKYHPELIPSLAPIVSPMIAAGKVVCDRYGADALIVFIGPCVAKKLEILDENVAGVIDEALTFDELIRLFDETGIDPAMVEPSELDAPRAHLGQIYPISGGLLKSAGISSDVMDEEVIVVEGRQRCLNIINELAQGKVNSRMIDILFCEGCVNGPGMVSPLNHYEKRECIISWVKSRTRELDQAEWHDDINEYRHLDFSRRFEDRHIEQRIPEEPEIQRILLAMGKRDTAEQINCGACGYETCRDLAVAVARGIAEKEMCLQYTIDNLERSHRELAEAQAQLIQTEKLASVGQLAAGVAHEINNPLGTIVLYSHLLLKQLKEVDPAADDVRFIIDEAERCRTIVGSLLNFARQGKLVLSELKPAALIDPIIAMLRRREDFETITMDVEIAPDLPLLYVDADQMRQVLINLAMNACEAMPDGGRLCIAVQPGETPREIQIRISDTGMGISRENLGRLFTPFFTTKQIGKGTGLGLPIAYGIIKLHHGQIGVQSESGKGSVFTITIPSDLRDYPSAAQMSPRELAAALSPSHHVHPAK
ncbi:MAG: [Fe-Fe] hydrogenase large subunit C-terminal domain-containing protein [Bacteroidota bacterium]|jgi:signal transduction histidine kinase/iron only hydrogenase large subunit-like protein|nr:[Fe-Fe] hydrogenase large subunit C-terminal domain-containing protein [Bacteroidota bacterium]